jgi:hypothetical protein
MNFFERSFFTVPMGLFAKGLMASLRGSSVQLLLYIYYEAARTSQLELGRTNVQITAATGLSESAIRRARTQLKERGFIEVCREDGGMYWHALRAIGNATLKPHLRPRKSPFGSPKTKQEELPEGFTEAGLPLGFDI